MAIKALGQQLAIELYGCDREILNDQKRIQEIMRAAALEAGATIVAETFHKFNPHGVSGGVIIAESHLMIHTWPEYGYAAVDVFTCGDTIQPSDCYEYLKKHLRAENTLVTELKRGILDVPGKLLHKPGA